MEGGIRVMIEKFLGGGSDEELVRVVEEARGVELVALMGIVRSEEVVQVRLMACIMIKRVVMGAKWGSGLCADIEMSFLEFLSRNTLDFIKEQFVQIAITYFEKQLISPAIQEFVYANICGFEVEKTYIGLNLLYALASARKQTCSQEISMNIGLFFSSAYQNLILLLEILILDQNDLKWKYINLITTWYWISQKPNPLPFHLDSLSLNKYLSLLSQILFSSNSSSLFSPNTHYCFKTIYTLAYSSVTFPHTPLSRFYNSTWSNHFLSLSLHFSLSQPSPSLLYIKLLILAYHSSVLPSFISQSEPQLLCLIFSKLQITPNDIETWKANTQDFIAAQLECLDSDHSLRAALVILLKLMFERSGEEVMKEIERIIREGEWVEKEAAVFAIGSLSEETAGNQEMEERFERILFEFCSWELVAANQFLRFRCAWAYYKLAYLDCFREGHKEIVAKFIGEMLRDVEKTNRVMAAVTYPMYAEQNINADQVATSYLEILAESESEIVVGAFIEFERAFSNVCLTLAEGIARMISHEQSHSVLHKPGILFEILTAITEGIKDRQVLMEFDRIVSEILRYKTMSGEETDQLKEFVIFLSKKHQGIYKHHLSA